VIRVRGAVIVSVIVACLFGCDSDPRQLDTDDLTALLSVSMVTKTRLQDTTRPELISGLIVDTTVIHTGFITIDVPFRMTWSIRRDGAVFASATRDFEAGFAPGQSESVRLTLRFDPVATLDGVSDAVTFDLLGTSSLSILGD
jgi:hypothetical protein